MRTPGSVTLAAKKTKYLGINLIKYIQDLYKQNHKSDEKYQRRTKIDISCSWIGRLNLFKMSVLNLVYRFNAISIKNPSNLFCEYQQTDSKIYMERQ